MELTPPPIQQKILELVPQCDDEWCWRAVGRAAMPSTQFHAFVMESQVLHDGLARCKRHHLKYGFFSAGLSPELEQLVDIARESGALGAKLTGGGGGGSIIALCDGDTAPVAAAIRAAGYQAIPVSLGAGFNGA